MNQHANVIPAAVAQRRPLVIRKNNFVLTKGGESSNDSNLRDHVGVASNAASSAVATGGAAPPETTPGIARVLVQSLPSDSAAPQAAKKLNTTLHSNNSGNRALNNTQKIGRAGHGHGVASNETLGSDASLSQTRN